MLVLACALPTIFGFAALGYDMYSRERLRLVHDAEDYAQALLLAVERDLENGETAARALASSPSLESGDLAAFHLQARSILRPAFPAHSFVLSDVNGNPVLNTQVAFGMPLPPIGNAERIREVVRTRDALTSGLNRAAPSLPYAVSVDIPVWRAGDIVNVLSVQFRPERFIEVVREQRIPAAWTAQVFDGQHQMVARSLNPQRYIGVASRPEMRAAVAQATQGSVELHSHEGTPMLSVFRRSPARGWFVSVAHPANAAYTILSAALANVLLVVASLLTIGFATAWIIGGSIGRSVRALCQPAGALGRGDALAVPPLQIREAAEVAASLQEVERELQRYRSGLEGLVRERTEELERSKALVEALYASAPLGLSLLDRNLRVLMVNEHLAAINAKPVSEHIGRTLPEIVGPIGLEYEIPYRTVLETGKPLVGIEGTAAVPCDPGVERHWVVSYYPVFGPAQDLIAISCVVLDVTERKQLDQRLRDNDEQFRVLYESSSDAHMLVTLNAGFVGGNKAAAALFGCAGIDEFLTLSPATTSPEFQLDGSRSAEKAQHYLRLALETGTQHFEWLHQRVDGSLFHADVLINSVDIGGKGVMLSTVRDISERIAAESALRATTAALEQNERFIRTVTDNVPGMVAYWDAQLRCQFANKVCRDWFGLDQHEIIGRAMEEIQGAEMAAKDAPFVQAVLGGKSQQFEREIVKASGEIAYLWASYIPDFDEQGKVRGFYVLNSDITELKRTERSLQQLNEQLVQAVRRAEQASSAKSEFLANMSHEIRTPMNAIVGLARLLEESPLGRRERGYVARMQMSTRSLLGILNDVLDFSKIEAGQLAIEYTAFRLGDVLDSLSVLAADNAWNKGVEPVFAVAPDVPLTLVGDPMRLEQVLLNLISNAVKFTDLGEVVLSIAKVERGADEQGAEDIVLAFSVRDTGIGIPADKQLHMFDAFSQGDSSTSRRYGGTGLGLAICRRLVSLMGGAINVDSAPGQGSEFRFELRFGLAPDAGALTLPADPRMANLSVLVVDDNASARESVACACEAFGWHADRAAGGAEALDMLRQASRAGVGYDLMFLDCAMPELDAISVLTYARGDPTIVVPRFALMVAENPRERLAGMAGELDLDVILSKPVTPQTLADAVIELCTGRAPADVERLPAPLAGRLAGIHVLLVEDNQINQEVANYILLHAGAAVDIAGNGQVAIDMLAVAPERYDAVLMDIQMPVMNGYQATAAIRQMGLTHLPVIAMTANAMEDDRKEAIAVGMNAHLAKPINVDLLVATLNRVTAGGDAREMRAAPRYGAPDTGLVTEAPLPAHIPGIDLRATLPRFGGNFANFAALFKRFESSQGDTVNEVRRLLRGADRQGALTLLHRMRGVAANLGAVELAARALDTEHALRGASEAEAASHLDALETVLAGVLAAARTLQLPAAPGRAQAKGDMDEMLAKLLSFLQNNNLKAIAEFETLRAPLAGELTAAEATALADAVATLDFTAAAVLVREILSRRKSA